MRFAVIQGVFYVSFCCPFFLQWIYRVFHFFFVFFPCPCDSRLLWGVLFCFVAGKRMKDGEKAAAIMEGTVDHFASSRPPHLLRRRLTRVFFCWGFLFFLCVFLTRWRRDGPPARPRCAEFCFSVVSLFYCSCFSFFKCFFLVGVGWPSASKNHIKNRVEKEFSRPFFHLFFNEMIDSWSRYESVFLVPSAAISSSRLLERIIFKVLIQF